MANGFDTEDPANARQNNYAWSMAEFGNHVYVGTARNTFYMGFKSLGLEPPADYTPDNAVNNAEIWRHRKDDGRNWERVYTAPEDKTVLGFRVMVKYTDENGVPALYAGCHTINDTPYLAMSINGTSWELIPAGIPDKFGTRSMTEHRRTLYISATDASNIGEQRTFLYSSKNPKKGWQSIDFTGTGIRGEITSMISYNGCLYIGTSPSGGFEVWKSHDPSGGDWELVVDKGAGDELNEVPISMEVHSGNLYVGTAVWMAVKSVDPDKKFVPLKGFDLIRINDNDDWEVIVGKEPLVPTVPTKGTRNCGKYESGFGNIFNNYCWQLRSFDGSLFVSSWDSSLAFYTIIRGLLTPKTPLTEENAKNFFSNWKTALALLSQTDILDNIKNFNASLWLRTLVGSIFEAPQDFGFDLFASSDGERFRPLSYNGFGNPNNYGLRTLLPSGNEMYAGTANPVSGCEVWVTKVAKR